MNFDWINWWDGVWASVYHSGTHRFTFESDSGWLFYKVELLLRQYHIPVYGREVVSNEEQAIQVRRRQAKWAEYILTCAGVPLTCPLLDSRNDLPSGVTRKMPKPWTKGSGATTGIAHIMDFMDGVLPGKRMRK